MRRLRAPLKRPAERESTIPLINVVFLLLVFFIVAGTLSAPRDRAIDFATARAFDPAVLDPSLVYVDAKGALRVGGDVVDAQAAVASVSDAGRKRLTVVPDRRLEAARFLAILAELRAASDMPIAILTQRPGAETP